MFLVIYLNEMSGVGSTKRYFIPLTLLYHFLNIELTKIGVLLPQFFSEKFFCITSINVSKKERANKRRVFSILLYPFCKIYKPPVRSFRLFRLSFPSLYLCCYRSIPDGVLYHSPSRCGQFLFGSAYQSLENKLRCSSSNLFDPLNNFIVA